MKEYYNGFVFSDDKNLLQIESVEKLLSTTYWAAKRSRSAIEKSINNSLCFGVYKDEKQIGFARCVTDYAVIYWLCDVVIDADYRGIGIGSHLVESIVNDERLVNLRAILASSSHQSFYLKFGLTFLCTLYLMKKIIEYYLSLKLYIKIIIT